MSSLEHMRCGIEWAVGVSKDGQSNVNVRKVITSRVEEEKTQQEKWEHYVDKVQSAFTTRLAAEKTKIEERRERPREGGDRGRQEGA